MGVKYVIGVGYSKETCRYSGQKARTVPSVSVFSSVRTMAPALPVELIKIEE